MAVVATVTSYVRPQRFLSEVDTSIDNNPALKQNFGLVHVVNGTTAFKLPSPPNKVYSVKLTPMDAYAIAASAGYLVSASNQVPTEVTESNLATVVADTAGFIIGDRYITVTCATPGNAAGADFLYEVIGE